MNLKQSFLEWGGSQADFVRITGIDKATTSACFLGKRGLSDTQRLAIYEGFKAVGNLPQGIAFIIADLKDRLPEGARPEIEINAKRGSKKKPSSPREIAIQDMIELLNEHDPLACDLARLWYDVRHKP